MGLPDPPSGEWSGEYQDMPCVANEEHAVKYKLTFKANGAVLGTGSSAEGEFSISGIYNLYTGIVAWSQFPLKPRPNAKATEFYGDVSIFASGPAKITGTFLTPNGRYCIVNLVQPTTSECNGKIKEESGLPQSSPTALPTLLTGSMTPIRDGKPSFFPKS